MTTDSELAGLPDQWREIAKTWESARDALTTPEWRAGYREAIHSCADHLEAVLSKPENAP